MNYVGTEHLIDMAGVTVLVTIEDMKAAYGQTRALIQPVAGTGRTWVQFDRLRPYDPGTGYTG